MRLPEPVYEGLPYLYVIAGTLFNGGVLYVGLNAPWAAYYLVIGICCTIVGLVVFYRRQKYRGKGPAARSQDAGTH